MEIMRSHCSTSASTTGPREHQPGVVDQGVEPPESIDGLLHGRFSLAAVGDVDFYHQRGAAGLLGLSGEGLQAVAATGPRARRRRRSRRAGAPIPLLAPVTTATVPLNVDVIRCPCGRGCWTVRDGRGPGRAGRGPCARGP